MSQAMIRTKLVISYPSMGESLKDFFRAQPKYMSVEECCTLSELLMIWAAASMIIIMTIMTARKLRAIR